MELILTFQNLGISKIPIDYQYYLSSWLYGIISKGNEEYATFLHNDGYKVSDSKLKTFKHFCFSWFDFENYKIDKRNGQIEIHGSEFRLRVRFLIDEAMKHFVKGLFTDQLLTLKNGRDSQVVFPTVSVDIRDRPYPPAGPYQIYTKTPIVIGRKQDNGNDLYLQPYDDGYAQLFFRNLADKYTASGLPWHDKWDIDKWRLTINTDADSIRSKKVTIKPGSKNVDVRGFLFRFEINIPQEVLEVGLMGGFGKHCAQGFGFCDVKH